MLSSGAALNLHVAMQVNSTLDYRRTGRNLSSEQPETLNRKRGPQYSLGTWALTPALRYTLPLFLPSSLASRTFPFPQGSLPL